MNVWLFLGVQIGEGVSFKIKPRVDFFEKLVMLREKMQIHSIILTPNRQLIKIKFNLMANKEPKTVTRGRDAKTGEFTTVKEARRHPNTHVVERVPKPGYGDTKKH